jgi:thymidine phosphorylase
MVALLGGPGNFLGAARAALPAAPVVVAAAPDRAGFVERIDVRAVGMAVVELGGGRARASDTIDPAVGLTNLAGLGAEVSPQIPLALVHARDEGRAFAAVERLRAAYVVGAAPPLASDPVIARIAEGGA